MTKSIIIKFFTEYLHVNNVILSEDVFEKCIENIEGEADNQVFQHLNLHHRSDVTARSCPRIGGAEAEQDGCVLGSGELRERSGGKSLKFRQTRH